MLCVMTLGKLLSVKCDGCDGAGVVLKMIIWFSNKDYNDGVYNNGIVVVDVFYFNFLKTNA